MPMRVRPYGEEPWHRLKKGQVILNWGRGIFKNSYNSAHCHFVHKGRHNDFPHQLNPAETLKKSMFSAFFS